jgi:hypothetical protein
MNVQKLCQGLLVAGVLFHAACPVSAAQTMPSTEGESLSGHRVILAQAIQGHPALIVGSFSKEAASGCEEWLKAVRLDPALASVTVYQAASLERAPGFIRGVIKSTMRKQTPQSIQDKFIVLTRDDALWRNYFGVTSDKEPYLVLFGASGQILWHGHGSAANLEPLLKTALK